MSDEPASDYGPRCEKCGALLAIKLTRPWLLDCHRCHQRNEGVLTPAPSYVLE